MTACTNCGAKIVEVKTGVDDPGTNWFHSVSQTIYGKATNQIRLYCDPDVPAGPTNWATPPTISDAETQMHLDELDELVREVL